MAALAKVIYSLEDIQSMANPYSSRSYCKLHIVIEVVLSLSCVICLLQMHMRVFLDDSVSNPYVRLHGAEGIFLLHEVNAHMFVPIVRTGLVEELEVFFLAEHLQSKEDESC